ncbi:hypothetical protein CDAR_228781 [Caerostris darwini]|uniref:Uncharacterized protein n=1 Tax=Caerostris darwini TaxID=1538125 RepID=A0AAV4PDF9_9ARAC|nr:hypothetical protein CDAR_228781 [Caerostris darwini]
MLPPKLIGILLAYLDAVVRKIKGVQELMSIMTIDIHYSGRSSAAHLPPPPDIASGCLTGVSKDSTGNLARTISNQDRPASLPVWSCLLTAREGRKGKKGVRRIEPSILAGNDQQ